MRRFMSTVSISVLFLLLLVSVVNAATLISFVLNGYGDNAEVEADHSSGDIALYVTPSRGYDDTTLGMSLSKKTIFGWKFISRCNPSIENGSMVQCRWYNQDNDRYKGTVVINSLGLSERGNQVTGALSLDTNLH